MNLIGEQFVPNKVDKSKKTRKILLILIVLVIIAIIAVVTSMVFLKKSKITYRLNGAISQDLKNIVKFEEDGNISIPIREMAELLQYESYNGNYVNRSEDEKECYAETSEEVVTFKVGENKIEKIDKNTQETTYYTLHDPIKMVDGKLYTTEEGIEFAFNLNFNYDDKKRIVTVQTMQYLVEAYKNSIIQARF